MKPLENFVQFGCFALGAIQLPKIVERFTAPRRILFNAHPEVFGLVRQLPFRGESGQRKFTFRPGQCQSIGRLPKRFELRVRPRTAARMQVPLRDCTVRQTQVFGVAPSSGPCPVFQTRPILHGCISIRDCDRRRRRIQSCSRQLVHPLHNVSSESVLIHPLNQRCEIRCITRRERFHFFKQLPEFFFV